MSTEKAPDLIDPQKVNVGNNNGTNIDSKENFANPNEADSSQPPKEPIEPYKVDASYKQTLKTQLKQDKHYRPVTLFQPEIVDITKDSETLLQEIEQRREKLEAKMSAENENEERENAKKYKESAETGHTLIEDPMALFADAKKAYIDQYYKVSDLFVCCPIYYNYRISLQYEENAESYYLFRTIELSPVFQHNCCPNQARNITIKMDNYVPGKKEEDTQTFIYLKKKFRCAFSCLCACCTRPIFEVTTLNGNLGRIIEDRTLCNPVLRILDANDTVKYWISGKCSQCGYCCRDQCCNAAKCAVCMFDIFDGADEQFNTSIGMISKNHRSGKRFGPDYDQMEIDFPAECSCQNKVLIMCGSILMEYLYFQNNWNFRRCNGNPRFIPSSIKNEK